MTNLVQHRYYDFWARQEIKYHVFPAKANVVWNCCYEFEPCVMWANGYSGDLEYMTKGRMCEGGCCGTEGFCEEIGWHFDDWNWYIFNHSFNTKYKFNRYKPLKFTKYSNKGLIGLFNNRRQNG